MNTMDLNHEHQYVAGYEIYVDGHPFWWGHLAVRIDDADPLLHDPQGLLDRLCAMAAQRHDVAASQVRLKMVSRL
ncbi:hypothetical protein [Stenotrophomonas sp. SY1]|jgi:hypothetical protein|uniref:hypothetical protein n=1 Tax=Stenotrophomonas sp. SY1 TaxID=477235 RepID=UPI001E2C7D36|nr:hypothetical protein [Stenotrophomonas sp. SY1]MCD9085519.1 hypothetical protein [Stenotrophomonas sp. SY1]